MTDRDILVNVKEIIRTELVNYANEQLDRLVHRYICEIGKKKGELVRAILNQVDCVVKQDKNSRNITVEIIVKDGTE